MCSFESEGGEEVAYLFFTWRDERWDLDEDDGEVDDFEDALEPE